MLALNSLNTIIAEDIREQTQTFKFPGMQRVQPFLKHATLVRHLANDKKYNSDQSWNLLKKSQHKMHTNNLKF